MADTKFSLLRQRLGRLTGPDNIKVGVPTGGFTTDKFQATALSFFSDDFFNGWHGRFYEGAHKGTDFEVSDFASEKGVFTIEPVLSSEVKATDLFEIYKYTTPVDMGEFINLAIARTADKALQDLVDETIQLVSLTYEYVIPPAFAYLDRIYEETATKGRYSASSSPLDYRWWRILHTNPRRIWLDADYFAPTAARKLRLVGQARQTELVDDDDLCFINQAFIIYQAKALWHEAHIRSSGSDFENNERQMVIAQALADVEKEEFVVTPTGRRV